MPEHQQVAIVVPVYRWPMTPEEQLSWQHLRHFLGAYDVCLAAPEGLHGLPEGIPVTRFDPAYFESVDAYSRLLLSRGFYEAFSDYEYLLIYQLDSLVFSDDLAAWCALGYDYLGAPWLRDAGHPAAGFSRVGNGGLSLRRVASFLRVIDSRRHLDEPVSFWKEMLTVRLPDVNEKFGFPDRLLKKARVLRAVRRGSGAYRAHYTLNEDHFWSDRAPLFDPEFEIAPVEVGLRFAFERAPRFCFEQNGRRLPFGCHAWAKWDRAFWEPHLLKIPA